MIGVLWALASLWLGAAAAGAPGPPATPDQGGTTAAIRGADLDLLAAVRGIASRVAKQRGEAFRRPPIAVRVADDMRTVAADIRALNVLPRERLEARGRAWADVGLGDPSSPATLYRTLARDLEGIGFDPSGNRLLVAPDRLTDADFAPEAEGGVPATVLMMTGVRVDEPVVAHLLMHVRQLERSGADWLAPTTDELLARSAWAEGEANLVAFRYLFSGMGLADDEMLRSLGPAEVLDGRLVPAELGELPAVEGALTRFVYEEGLSAAMRAYHGGGWERLDEAMASRGTCRDLLHLERAPRAPVEVAVPAPPAAAALRLADRDSLGEQAIFVLISQATAKHDLGLQAADGWVGDALRRWEPERGDPGRGITAWVTRWEKARDAEEFEYALGRALAERFPGRPPIRLEDGQRLVATAGQVVRLARRGAQVELRVAARELDPLPEGVLVDPHEEPDRGPAPPAGPPGESSPRAR